VNASGAAVDHWALSAYPISQDQKANLKLALGHDFDVAVLPQLRAGGVMALVGTLMAVRAENGYVLSTDANAPLLPILRLIATMTRCRRLAVVRTDGQVDRFRRSGALADLVRLIAGSARGVVAAARCRLELSRLRRSRRLRPPVGAVGRVVFLKTNLWFGVKAGGSVGHVAGVANALAARSSGVDLFSVEEPPLLSSAIRFHQVSHDGAFGFPFELNYYVYQRLFVREVIRALAGGRPDLLYQRMSLANYSGVSLARTLGVPLIVEYNGSEVWVSKHWGRQLHFRRLAEDAEQVMLHHADLIVTVSEVLGDELESRGIERDRILVHPNCVDPNRFDPARHTPADRDSLLRQYGIDPSSVVCGFIGTFGMWHGVVMLAETIREMVETRSEWLSRNRVHFLLVGDGVLMPDVRAVLDSSRSSQFVTLTGLVEQHEAPRHLAACDVLLSPHIANADGSRFFGSPTKLFEYMATGRAIVASDLDQIGQVLAHSLRASALPRDDGAAAESLAVLIEPGNRGQLIEAIEYLVERPERRAQLGRNARSEVLQRFTWAKNVDEVIRRVERLRAASR
jgi:glycosyltransferase involved in cell wall biosynthesis